MEMMKSYINYIAMLLLLTGCADQIIDEDIKHHESHTYQLDLQCEKPDYESNNKSRAFEGWSNGDELFIQFDCNTNRLEGYAGRATYNNGTWSIEIPKPITENLNGDCVIWYLDGEYACEFNPYSTTNTYDIYVKPTTCIYNDLTKYEFTSSGKISIGATLSPALSRVRFKGEKGTAIEIKGVRYVENSFDLSLSNEYLTGSGNTAFELICNEEINGEYYTPYIYGDLPSNTSDVHYAYSNKFISLKIKNYVYARKDIFNDTNKPKSVTFICPTIDNHNNWAEDIYTYTNYTTGKKDLNYRTNQGIEYKDLISKTGITIKGDFDYNRVQTTTESDVKIYDLDIYTSSGKRCDGTSLFPILSDYFLRKVDLRCIDLDASIGDYTNYTLKISGQNVQTNSTVFVYSNF